MFNGISFVLKPFLKGPYGGYFLGVFEKKLFVSAEKFIQILAPNYTENFLWVEYAFTQIFMIANKASIRFKTIYAFIYVNFVILFFFWICASVIIVVGYFLTKSENNKNKIEEEKQIKND